MPMPVELEKIPAEKKIPTPEMSKIHISKRSPSNKSRYKVDSRSPEEYQNQSK